MNIGLNKTCGAITTNEADNVYGRCGKPGIVQYSLAEEHSEEPGYYCVSHAAFRLEDSLQKSGS
jgi:hypothetical protein